MRTGMPTQVRSLIRRMPRGAGERTGSSDTRPRRRWWWRGCSPSGWPGTASRGSPAPSMTRGFRVRRPPTQAEPAPHCAAWTLGTVAAILAKPRYTGRKVWNLQRTDFDLVDGAAGQGRLRHDLEPSGGRNLARGHRAWPSGGSKARPGESAGRQSGYRVGHPAELADRRELAALAHRPPEQFLRVGVDRVQVAAITGDRFVADALLALPG